MGTLEAQPELEPNASVRAFRPQGNLLYTGFETQSLDDLVSLARTPGTRAIVVNFDHAAQISAFAMGDLSALQRRLMGVPCSLIVLVESPLLRELLNGAGLSRKLMVVASRTELAQRLDFVINPPDDGITEESLAEALAANISLEDILREKNL